MSTPTPLAMPKSQTMKHIVAFASIAFIVIEVLIAAGLVNVQNSPYLPPNLQTQDEWWQNPIWWVIGVTLLVNFFGYVENVVVNNQPYDYNKFLETFAKYTPLIVIFSQALPNQHAALASFALDYIKRALEGAGTKKS